MKLTFSTSVLLSTLTGLVLLTSACDNEYNFPYCEETVTELEADAITPSGHSVAEVLAAIEGERQVPLTYSEPSPDGVIVEHAYEGSTTVTLELTALRASKLDPEVGSLRWVESEEVYPTTGIVPSIAIECYDRIEIDAELGFATLDGAFEELFAVTVNAAIDWNGELSEASIVHEYDPEQLEGGLRIESIEPMNPSKVDHRIELDYPLTDVAAEMFGVEIGEPVGGIGGGAEYESSSKGDEGLVSYGMFWLGMLGQ